MTSLLPICKLYQHFPNELLGWDIPAGTSMYGSWLPCGPNVCLAQWLLALTWGNVSSARATISNWMLIHRPHTLPLTVRTFFFSSTVKTHFHHVVINKKPWNATDQQLDTLRVHVRHTPHIGALSYRRFWLQVFVFYSKYTDVAERWRARLRTHQVYPSPKAWFILSQSLGPVGPA